MSDNRNEQRSHSDAELEREIRKGREFNLAEAIGRLAGYVQRTLDSEYLLKELVREADAEWGRALGERPYFDKEGCPPHPEDPYTAESVRATLSRLREKLTAGDA